MSDANAGGPAVAHDSPSPGRQRLMEQHRAARQRRDGAQLGSAEFRAAAEDVARIEIAIAQLEEPATDQP